MRFQGFWLKICSFDGDGTRCLIHKTRGVEVLGKACWIGLDLDFRSLQVVELTTAKHGVPCARIKKTRPGVPVFLQGVPVSKTFRQPVQQKVGSFGLSFLSLLGH